ncbi:MAG: hypothetical protein Hyperionvirus9_24 [Hyperionvirus sp.]|uniref:Uncharacterized protein n=1 Tax=Hyperionvirus sp. TaxID=2487770 RepID=A0A3G5A8L7_9VIRU|nr:MAG: hypothetical protein Hyperionvirus9_24 [Hyperionvirus sp.]
MSFSSKPILPGPKENSRVVVGSVFLIENVDVEVKSIMMEVILASAQLLVSSAMCAGSWI